MYPAWATTSSTAALEKPTFHQWPPGHARSGIQITQFRHDTDGRWQTCHWHTERRVGARLFGAFAGPLSRPGMAYWMIACSVYLYIATLGVNVRICRDEGRW